MRASDERLFGRGSIILEPAGQPFIHPNLYYVDKRGALWHLVKTSLPATMSTQRSRPRRRWSNQISVFELLLESLCVSERWLRNGVWQAPAKLI